MLHSMSNVNANRTTSEVDAETAGESPETGVCRVFLGRIHALTNLKLLCQLTKSVQKHRGASMGYLSGETAFLAITERQQASIERIFLTLELHNANDRASLSSREIEQLANDWNTIKLGWREDQILHNYNFHSYLIECLQRSIRSTLLGALQAHPEVPLIIEKSLLEIVFVTLPDTIEALATLRGLSTNATVVKACGSDTHMRIAFLCKDIPKRKRALLKALEANGNAQVKSHMIKPIRAEQKNLQQFLLSVKMHILEGHSIELDGTQLFALCTEIIDTLWAVMDQGVQMMERRLADDFTNPIQH